MNTDLFDQTKVSAYFLWEYTKHENALGLWYCAEDMACYLERMGITGVSRIEEIKRLGVYDIEYVAFVRHLAFRIYVYTCKEDKLTNWFAAEKLIKNGEWCDSITKMAMFYATQKDNAELMSGIRSEGVRSYYDVFNAK